MVKPFKAAGRDFNGISIRLTVGSARAWPSPTAVAPTGVVVWLCTVVVGMLLRKATAAGTPVGFVIVTAAVNAALLLGWRAVATAIPRRRV